MDNKKIQAIIGELQNAGFRATLWTKKGTRIYLGHSTGECGWLEVDGDKVTKIGQSKFDMISEALAKIGVEVKVYA